MLLLFSVALKSANSELWSNEPFFDPFFQAFIVVKFRVARSKGPEEKGGFLSKNAFPLIRWKIIFSASINSFCFFNVADFFSRNVNLNS